MEKPNNQNEVQYVFPWGVEPDVDTVNPDVNMEQLKKQAYAELGLCCESAATKNHIYDYINALEAKLDERS